MGDYAEMEKLIDSGALGEKKDAIDCIVLSGQWDEHAATVLADLGNERTVQDIRDHVESGGVAEITRLNGRVVVTTSRPGQGQGRRRQSFHTGRRGSGAGLIGATMGS